MQKFLYIFIFLFFLFFSFVAFARHDNFHSLRLDLGNMEQTVWNIAHGNGFTFTDPMGTENISRLAAHADFLLILITPFYMLWSDPKMLLLIQTFVICLGSLPVFWIARDRLRSDRIALLFSLAYLLYPPLERMMLHDFHAVSLSMTFLLFAYWYMIKKSYALFVLFAVLAGLGKEQIWFTVGLLGVYIVFWQKNIRLGLSVMVMGFGLFYYLFWYAIPSVSKSGEHFAVQYLSEFGQGQNNILLGILRRPWEVVSLFIQSDRLAYYYRLLMPVGFLPLFSPSTLLFATHTIVINALSSNGLMRQIDYQYTADIIPFLFIAAIDGYKKILKYWKNVGCFVVVCVVMASYLWGEIPLTREDRFFYFIWPAPGKNSMQEMEREIGPMYTVSVTNNIGAHFAKRQYLYNFPVNAQIADYTLVRLGDRFAWPSRDEQTHAVLELLQSKEHTLITQDGDFYAFKRK